MTAENIKAEEIFHEAIEITDQVKRSAYLDTACGQDGDLRLEVEALLRAHEEAGDFLGRSGRGEDSRTSATVCGARACLVRLGHAPDQRLPWVDAG